MNKEFFKSRRFRQGSVATGITVVVLAVIVLLNMVVATVDQVRSLGVDLTQDKIFSVSDSTKDFLSSLDRDVEIFVLNNEQAFTAQSSAYAQAAEVLKKYARLSDHVTLGFVDLVSNPGFTSRFPTLNLHSDYVLVTCGDDARMLDILDLFNLVEQNGYYFVASSKVEQTLTSTIASLVSDEVVTAAMVVGHNELPMEGLAELLALNNYQVLELSLLSQEIPDDVKLLVIAGPQADYSSEELQKLERYLYNGGRYGKTLFYMAALDQPALPELEGFLAGWNIGVGEGTVFERNPQWRRSGLNFPVADYAENDYSKVVQRSGLGIYMPNSRPLEDLTVGNVDVVTVTTLLEFTETAGIRAADSSPSDWSSYEEDSYGPFPALLLAQQGTPEGDNSYVLTSATPLAVDQGILAESVYANSTYFLSLFSALTQRQDTVLTEAKQMNSAYLDMSDAQIILWGAIFLIVVPLAVLISGGVIFLHRRHL